MNPKVDFYFNRAQKWQAELEKLRTIVLDCALQEDVKWGVPCYNFQKKNIVLIHVFKEYCALLFFKGALLKDTNSILVQQTKNVQAARQIRFTSEREIDKMAKTVKAYIHEAIEIEKAGLKVEFKKTTEFDMPKEFQNKLKEMPDLKIAFNSLTPGRQRAYLLHFSTPKQSQTRVSRIEKCIKQILNGIGLNDNKRK
ncbi:MAG: YdeI/OmpD-associated family protein [Bacteroidetes bacterium]|nr:YdeI/OmpD-associated family protein [Bacteroidota bacterium]